MEEIFAYAKTDFTKTVHNSVYSAINPTRPELSQEGRTILITGGGDNLGLAIDHAFVQAGARTIIITGRREDVLIEAKAQVEKHATELANKTKVLVRSVDITDDVQVNALWAELEKEGITVDVLVSNAAKPPKPKPILDDIDDIWSQVETNARAPLYMTKKLMSQPGEGQRVRRWRILRTKECVRNADYAFQFVVNVSSAVIHSYSHSAVITRPGTVLSKTTGNAMFQLIALQTPHEKLQVISYNPGLLYNPYMKSLGLQEDRFDSREFNVDLGSQSRLMILVGEMAAAFAVWAASKEAAFLHGRFVWASWDVEEMASGNVRKQIEDDPYFLRSAIFPLKQGFKS